MTTDTAPPAPALLLGYAGLSPFFGLVALAAAGLWDGAAAALLAYGAVILSFMGGCRWGFACAGLGRGPSLVALTISVAPALLGWAALLGRNLLGDAGAATVLAAGFLALYAADVLAARAADAPTWWPKLRAPLTAGAAGSLIAFAAVV